MTIPERLDRLPLTALHVASLIICTFGWSSDIAEVTLSNALTPVFLAPPYNAQPRELSLLLAAIFAGGTLGAPVFGWSADRLGRRITLQIALLLLCASSLAAAASPNIHSLTICRLISGVALGAYPPLTAAYLSELLPPRWRGSLIMVCLALAFLGAPAIIFMMRGLYLIQTPGAEPWRWALMSGGLIAAMIAAMLFTVPESPRWLHAMGRHVDADHSCRRFEISAGIVSSNQPIAIGVTDKTKQAGTRALFMNPLHRGPLLILCLIYALGPWATVGFPLMSVAALPQKGFDLNDSLLFAGATMFGPTFGILTIAFAVDRIERRITLSLCAVSMIAIGMAFAASESLTLLIALGVIFNLISAVFSSALHIYSPELFPTQFRSSATAFAWGLGRAASALVPLVLLPLLTSWGPNIMMLAIVAALLGCLGLFATVCPPGLARKPVL